MAVLAATKSPELRQEPRLQVPGLTARFAGRTVQVIDVSLHGLRISPMPELSLPIYSEAVIELLIPVMGVVSIYQAEVCVVWSGSKEVGLAFASPGGPWRRILANLERRDGVEQV